MLNVSECLFVQVPDLVGSLSGLYAMVESRVGAFTKLCKLQGRLDLMLSQVQVILYVISYALEVPIHFLILKFVSVDEINTFEV